MEWGVSDCGKYSIRSLSAATMPEALQVMKDTFFLEETVCVITGINKNPDAIEELLQGCADAALDGVSLVAVEISTGKVVSAAFNRLEVPQRIDFDQLVSKRSKHPAVKAWLNFFTYFGERCNFSERYGVDCSLDLMCIGTVKEHRGNKLAALLNKFSIELCRKLKHGPVSHITIADLGPKYANIMPREIINKVPKLCYAINTSIGTKKITADLGFSVILRLPLSEYEWKNCSVECGPEIYIEGVAKILD